MKHARPRGLNRRRVEQLVSVARDGRRVGGRIDYLSRQFLGFPYKANPLIGSVDTAEVFTVLFDGFDCVTYIETVLALARASSVDDFVRSLRQIRYDQGCVRWRRRNHYMTAWIRNNMRAGIIGPLSLPGVPTIRRERVLNVVPGLAPRRIVIKCTPKPAVPRLERHLQSGDLIFFVSTRKNLDVFHAGIIVRDGDRLLMRHAARSKGFVIEQELSEFLRTNRMAGVMVVRPLEAARGR